VKSVRRAALLYLRAAVAESVAQVRSVRWADPQQRQGGSARRSAAVQSDCPVLLLRRVHLPVQLAQIRLLVKRFQPASQPDSEPARPAAGR
jgi:hypothetical protein